MPTGTVAVVYGPTASGKSGLALELAERLNGAVINADAIQLYGELEILTARPGPDAMARAPHLLYGVLSSATASSAAWWREAALREIARAQSEGRLPILAGGTGLYIKALVEGLSPVPPSDIDARKAATALYAEIGGEEFRKRLAAHDPPTAARLAPGDRQRLIRAWEVLAATGTPISVWQAMPRERGHDLAFRFIGLNPPRDALYRRIDARFLTMIERGAIAEAERFEMLDLPFSLPAAKALGLSELRRHIRGELTLSEAVAQAQQATRNYAKRQFTWFRHQIAPLVSAMPHSRHVLLEELSERKLAEIMSFIVRSG